jgi:phospholipid/cholesterol/gamma-HCH transport system substrate-binding protein
MSGFGRRRRRLCALLAAASLALSGCGFTGLYGVNLPGGADTGDHPYSVTIYFTNVLDLVPQSAVRVNDVPVGKVTSIALTKTGDTKSGDMKSNGWTAKIKVEVNGDVKLPSNATAKVKMTSLLGEKFVDLEQPSGVPASTPLENGSIIPITRTGEAPEVEDVLGALSLLLNGGGLEQIQTITTELNNALRGHESSIRDLLAQVNTFVGTLDSQKDKITNALTAINQLAISLNQQKATIVEALETLPGALKILKDDTGQLVTLLSSLSKLGATATDVIDASQTQLVGALKSLSPTLEALTATGSDLPEALKIAGTFPFELGASETFVKGDYANLSLFLDLNLSNELCGLSSALCGLSKLLGASSKSTKEPTASAATKPNAADAKSTRQLPAIPGAGG